MKRLTTELTCDSCGFIEMLDDISPEAPSDLGWKHEQGHDFCPECAPYYDHRDAESKKRDFDEFLKTS